MSKVWGMSGLKTSVGVFMGGLLPPWGVQKLEPIDARTGGPPSCALPSTFL
jgi:hypothetical protein